MMTHAAIRLYMIPGTGTDRRMFAPQLEYIPEMIVPSWLAPRNLKEPLESYAQRLADTIDTSEPFVLGGVSLGGMIAQEMAHRIKPEAVILISTCSSYKDLPLVWRVTGKFTRLLPDSVVKFSFGLLAKAARRTHLKRKETYAAMLEEMPPHLVRWQSGAATEWKLTKPLPMRVFQIHGKKDMVIPIKNVTPGKVVQNGSHLINVTHEGEVNQFISQCLAACESNPLPEKATILKMNLK
jgi:pimeloyl-ACP methyl ester carboxylesterase